MDPLYGLYSLAHCLGTNPIANPEERTPVYTYHSAMLCTEYLRRNTGKYAVHISQQVFNINRWKPYMLRMYIFVECQV